MIEEQEMKTLGEFSFVGEKVPVIVVGRNNDKRIVNVVWGKEQEGYFRWSKKGNLPNYTDVFYLSFDQKEPRGVLRVSNVLMCHDYSSFTDDFYRQEILEITAINDREYFCGELLLPSYFSSALRSCELGSKIVLTWVYKFNHRANQFEWVICRVKALANDEGEIVTEVAVEKPSLEIKEECAIEEGLVREDVTLFVMACETPLKGFGLLNHCLSSNNELYYFHKSLLSVTRFDKLKLDVSINEIDGIKMIKAIHKVEPASLLDFPNTIVRETKKMLIHRNDVMYLDSDPIPSRKSHNLRLKKLLAISGSSRVEVMVEEAFIYAIQNKAFEWTIIKVSIANETEDAEVVDEKSIIQEELVETEEKSLVEEDVKDEQVDIEEEVVVNIEHKGLVREELKGEEVATVEKVELIAEVKPKIYKIQVAYIVSIGSGTIDLIFGEGRKAYIIEEKYPLENPAVGQWIEIEMLEEQKNFEEIDFKSIKLFTQNPLVTPSCRQFYRVREGLLTYSEDDGVFMLNNIPIPDYVLGYIIEPRYKAYYRFEELLDYNPIKDKFVYKYAKMSELDLVQSSKDDIDEHLYPLRLRNKVIFEETLTKVRANFTELITPNAKEEILKSEENSQEVKLDNVCWALEEIHHQIVSYCLQRKTKRVVRKGLSQKRTTLSKKRK